MLIWRRLSLSSTIRFSLPPSSFSSTPFLQTNRSLQRMFSASSSPTDDPLAHVFAPPPNESPRDKENRVRAEQEAKKRSDAIDEEINKQRNVRKNSRPVKILLLGEPTILLLSSCAVLGSLMVSPRTRSKRIRCVLCPQFPSTVDSTPCPPATGKSTTLKSESQLVPLCDPHLIAPIRCCQTSS